MLFCIITIYEHINWKIKFCYLFTTIPNNFAVPWNKSYKGLDNIQYDYWANNQQIILS